MAKKAKVARKAASRKKKRPAATGGATRRSKARYPGMMGDGTEEQNLDQRGNPSARIRLKDVVAAFRKKRR
jgi:hypothetical protein